MTSFGTLKFILPLTLIFTVQCHTTEAGAMSTLMQSILDTLKNIENLLKDDSIIIEDKPKMALSRKPTPNKYLMDALAKTKNDNVNSNKNVNTNSVSHKHIDKDSEEVSDEKPKISKEKEKLGRRSIRLIHPVDKNLNKKAKENKTTKRPKLRAKINKNESSESKKEDKESESKDNDNNKENEEAVARLFEESDEIRD